MVHIGTLVRPKLCDAGRIADMIAAAMQDDPLCGYFFSGERERKRIGPILYRLIVKYGIHQGNLFAPSADYEGIAYWETHNDRRLTGIAHVVSDGFRLLAAAGLASVSRMAGAGRNALWLRRRHVPFPHWYLGLLAVGPQHQGKGYAGRLLRPVLSKLERDGMPCYLETHKTKNVSFYEHFGFRVVEELELPDSRVRQWCMLKGAPA